MHFWNPLSDHAKKILFKSEKESKHFNLNNLAYISLETEIKENHYISQTDTDALVFLQKIANSS